jgi:dihydroorotate dehydrogenase (fumarate)
MSDLSTMYLGIRLKNPLVSAASPLARDLDTPKRLEEAGIAAVVMDSLFEEQVIEDMAALDSPERPFTTEEESRSAEYLERLYHLKEELSVPVIASLNCDSTGAWVRFAAMFEEAGADALELNIYFMATDTSLTSLEVEKRYIDIIRSVRETVRIPIAVKVTPYFSAFAHVAREFDTAGANGLVLFNRFFQPDIDLNHMKVRPGPVLSTKDNSRLPLRWIAVLSEQLQCSLAASSGVHSSQEVLKLVACGADVAQMATILLQRGPGYVATILRDLEFWLDRHDYASLSALKGTMSYSKVVNSAEFERAHYIYGLTHYRGI